ncbi:hypothetical protein DKY63_28590 [Pseudomonas putida]|uniref:Uncharacterized protein n=1 Tax=Pseudomonas putida TaxID=303 RepID=A0A2Z4RRM4_PSEPU|nr:hypothetical protein DKY63_28590 [Pseudomonas putida]
MPGLICTGFARSPAKDNTNLQEQSLLAIASGQSASMLNVPPLSRASFAPTGFVSVSPSIG